MRSFKVWGLAVLHVGFMYGVAYWAAKITGFDVSMLVLASVAVLACRLDAEKDIAP